MEDNLPFLRKANDGSSIPFRFFHWRCARFEIPKSHPFAYYHCV